MSSSPTSPRGPSRPGRRSSRCWPWGRSTSRTRPAGCSSLARCSGSSRSWVRPTREVVLAYPTTDLKGQELLRAGFLDDLLGLIAPEARASCHVSFPRLDPALVDQPELAGSAADLRIRAAALASAKGETADLVRLARDPAHRQVLDGTAAALFVQQRRMRGTAFSEFEGMLGDDAAVRELVREYGPDYCYSPSQLETYIACPFQFFSKYVLDLKPVDEKDELDEDLTERGSRLHDILENFETLLKQQEGDPDLEQIAAVLVEQVRGQQTGPALGP